MKKKILLSVLGWYCLIFNAMPQVPPRVKPLQAGDKIADIALNNLGQFRTRAAKFSDLKSDLVILDFWATWCGSCIKTFPHIDSLAGQYKGRVQFLLVNSKPVTKDDQAKIKYLFSYTQKPKNVAFANEDTVLCKLFTVNALPHYVWLKKDGTVLAITDQEEVTGNNIRHILSTGAYPLSPNKSSEP